MFIENERSFGKAADMEGMRETIIAKASELFLRRSYEGVSIHDISQAVGLTKSSLYHHFPQGKEQIFREVALRFFSRFTFNFDAAPRTSLQEFCDALLQEIRTAIPRQVRPASPDDSGDGGVNFYGLMWDAFRNLSDIRSLVNDYARREKDAWIDAVTRAMDSGEIRSDIPPERVMQLFTNVFDGEGIAIIWKRGVCFMENVERLWGDLYLLLRI